MSHLANRPIGHLSGGEQQARRDRPLLGAGTENLPAG